MSFHIYRHNNKRILLDTGRRFFACLLSVTLMCGGFAPAALALPVEEEISSEVEISDQIDESDGQSSEADGELTASDDADLAVLDESEDEGSNLDESQKDDKKKKTKDSNKNSSKDSKKKSIKEEAKVATAKKAIQRMNSLATELELAYENLNEQQAELKALKKEIKKTKQGIKNADKSLAESKEKVTQYVRESYVNGKIRYLSVLLDATNFGDFVSHLMFLDILAESEQKAVEDMERIRDNLDKEKKKLEKQRVKQEKLTKATEESAKAIENALVEQVEYYAALPKKIQKKVRAYDGVKGSLSATAGLTGSHSTKGSHPEVVAEALKYLGVPYVWGGESTKGFDCSGLTLYCYKKATGKSLTHFARTQYSEGKRIAKSALMPGDLVFFGDSVATIHHVGIYMGNDKFIHAPHTGDVVKISTLSNRSDYIGACRP